MVRRRSAVVTALAALVAGLLMASAAPGVAVGSPTGQHTGRVWASISGGSQFTCGIRLDGSLWCWGGNGHGALGLGDYQDRLVPTQVGDASWLQVDGSDYFHTCGVQVDESLWCWGNNDSGQLGTGDHTDRLVPTPVEGSAQWSAVSTGYGHTCGIRVDQSLWCWGLNNGGQLGIGSDEYEVYDPTQVAPGSRWLSVTAGGYFTCGIHVDHSLWCWGGGGYGELGLGDGDKSHNVPVQVGSHADWAEVSAGYDFACGVRAAHSLWCWGYNYNGQLGVGDRVDRHVPTRLVGGFWAEVSNGSAHTCGLSVDGGLFCWGAGHHGDLGYGGATDQLAPLRVGTRSDWMRLTTGGGHTCAIRTTHGLLCWGSNLRGQLGLGTTKGRELFPRVV